jgi:hypothetical protein
MNRKTAIGFSELPARISNTQQNDLVKIFGGDDCGQYHDYCNTMAGFMSCCEGYTCKTFPNSIHGDCIKS